MRIASIFAAGLLSLALMPAVSSAALVTVSGTNVDFTYDDATLGLFGLPTVVGDTIYFTPTNFKAQSANGQGFVLVSSTINLVATLKTGVARFVGTSLQERGDYLLFGNGSFVSLSGQLRAFDANNPVFGAQTTSPIVTSSNLTINDGATHNWVATATNDFSGSEWNGVRSINSTLENILIAYTPPSNPASLAFIEKKFAGETVVSWTVQSAVPLPGALLFMFSGLLGLIPFAVRKRFNGMVNKLRESLARPVFLV